MINDGAVREKVDIPELPSSAQPSPANSESVSIPRIAMGETLSGKYWVLLNFPGRTSLTLATKANRDLAEELMDCARRVAAESLAYAAERLVNHLGTKQDGAL